MKKLKKILLINWLYFSKQLIEVEDINFLTGKNGAGKSTVIDALQIVLLGETNARNFNQAANEKSQRTVDGYLRADMDDNNPYSRRGKDFSSYIACEFLDDVEGTQFVIGIVFDCRSDGSRQDRFFAFDGAIPENCFIEGRQAMEISALRSYLKQRFGAHAKLYDSQKQYRNRPPTRKQEQLIAKLATDFPGVKKMAEYEDYAAHTTKANASALITMALEENWSAVCQTDGYMKYIATRPRAERLSSHGLFGDEDNVDLDAAMAELDSYTGNVWTHIISLKREDATRLGYDNANAWCNLIRAHRNDIAAAMKIPSKDFRWYAAYHDEGDHPHIHMMAWSAKPGQAYLSREGIRQIKSVLTNDVFKQELLHVYEQKSESRDELVREARDALLELTRQMQTGICNHPEVEGLMQQLSQALDSVTGKKSYGYLPKPIKKIVDEIVNQMERLPVVSDCYDRWLEMQGQVDSYYGGDERKRLPLSQQKEFRAIKNAVIHEAEHIRLGETTFEDAVIEQQDEPEDDLRADRTLWQIVDDVYDDTLHLAERDKAVEDLRAWAEDGDATAQYFLGKLYRDGGLLIPNSELAQDWFYKAARQDVVVAQYALGKLFLSDDLLVRDPKLGMEWLEYAASNGSHYAAYRVGKEYLRGKIVNKDVTRALRYLTDAANAENQYAQYLLGKLCLMGREVKYDKELALYWLTRAADQGNEYAQFFLDRADSLHPPSVMLAATRLLHHMSRIFQDNSLPKTGPVGLHIDRKQLQKLREKKIALGHKPDDHEEYTGPTLFM